MKKFLISFLLCLVSQTPLAMNHGGMLMDENGMIMNANSDQLPRDCPKISENIDITVHAGQQYAEKFTGKMFAFDTQEWQVKPCAKLNITFINDDQIRHQFMIHGLPGYLYPDGMFHLELNGTGQLQASLIVPSQKKTYLVHCELPQHMEKGMKAQLKVDGGDGDLPSIPGITAPINADLYATDWSRLAYATVVLSALFAIITVLIIIINAQKLIAFSLRFKAKLTAKKQP